MKRRLIAGIVGTVVASAALPSARAGIPNGPCESPVAFEDADVNVIVLPYLDETGHLTESALSLTLLLQQQLLLQIAPYGSVATVRLLGERDKCEVAQVREVLLERFIRRPTQSLVFVSGRIFQSDDEIRVQTFVSFERRGGLPAFKLDVGGTTVRAEAPPSSVALMPRTLSRKDLTDIVAAFSRSARIYEAPREGSKSRPLPVDSGRGRRGPTQYAVTEVRDQWMQITGSAGRGWLRTDARMGTATLAQRMPEFVFVEAVVGFLQSLPRAGESGHPGRGTAATEAAKRFISLAGADEDEQALAWAEVMQALIALAYRGGESGTAEASAHLDRAADLTPGQAGVRIMRAAVSMKQLQGQGGAVRTWKKARRDLLVATALGRGSGDANRYLGVLGNLALPPGWSQSDRQAILAEQQRLKQLSGSGVVAPPLPAVCASQPGTGAVLREVFHDQFQTRAEVVMCQAGVPRIEASLRLVVPPFPTGGAVKVTSARVGLKWSGGRLWEATSALPAGTTFDVAANLEPMACPQGSCDATSIRIEVVGVR